jgi:putative hemolysin
LKKSVLEISDLEKKVPLFNGKLGNAAAKLCMHLLAIDKVNRVYGNSCNYRGYDFTGRLLNDLGVSYRIGNAERLQQLPDGAFITISNHPYGGLDGIMLIDMMLRVRPDYKVMVNEILSLVKSMDDNFIPVQTLKAKRNEDISKGVRGIRESVNYLQQGHPVGLFPAGAVSNFEPRSLSLQDRPWQESVIRLIRVAKVPVLPVRFFDHNSALFYFLGLIDWRIRTLKMPSELFNKSKQYPRLGIGRVIMPEEIASYKSVTGLSNFLRQSVYAMPKPDSYVPNFM